MGRGIVTPPGRRGRVGGGRGIVLGWGWGVVSAAGWGWRGLLLLRRW